MTPTPALSENDRLYLTLPAPPFRPSALPPSHPTLPLQSRRNRRVVIAAALVRGARDSLRTPIELCSYSPLEQLQSEHLRAAERAPPG